MTEETRAELRKGIAKLVGAAAHLPADPDRPGYLDVRHNRRQYIVEVWLPENRDPAPLTTAQQLALSVLLGDEAVLPEALADYLLDKGHEYAVECFRKGVESANPFAAAVKAMTPALSAYAEAMAEIGRRVAESISSPPDVLNDTHPS